MEPPSQEPPHLPLSYMFFGLDLWYLIVFNTICCTVASVATLGQGRHITRPLACHVTRPPAAPTGNWEKKLKDARWGNRA